MAVEDPPIVSFSSSQIMCLCDLFVMRPFLFVGLRFPPHYKIVIWEKKTGHGMEILQIDEVPKN